VTCRYEVPAYYSEYGGNPLTIFKPGMVGVVTAIAPKVRRVGYPPAHDLRDEFLVVDYAHPTTGKLQRVGLNFCNAIRIKRREE
jgi:hypothetical protein